MACITTLQLTNFRNYDGVTLDGLTAGPVVLYGSNGAGKTNILEAVSFLTPGRGLRGVKSGEVQKKDSSAPWAVAAVAETSYGTVRIGTGRDPETERRIVRINGETAKSQAALAEYLSCVWLTPQMDRLFIDSAGTRRRFLDRLVFAFDPGHAGRVTRYENALSQRAKILKEHDNPDPAWLDGLEASMAETGVAIAAARRDLAARLQQAADRADVKTDFLFPRARLAVTGTVEELVGRAPALEVEEMVRYQLRQARLQEKLSGATVTGPHRSDLSVWYAAKSMPAAQCSTGEQKALLIGLILAHARLIAAERGSPPILLLDEVAAHLDEERRAGLYALLLDMKGQVWLTGTDAALFAGLREKASLFRVQDGRVQAARQSRAA